MADSTDPWGWLGDMLSGSGDAAAGDTTGGGDTGALLGGDNQDWGQAVNDFLQSYGLSGNQAPAAPAQQAPDASALWGREARMPAQDSGGGPQGWNLDTLLSKPNGMWNDVSGWLDRLASGDRAATGQAKLGIGALGLLGSLLQSRRPRGQLTPGQLQAMLKSPYGSWTPEQQASFNSYFYKPLPKFQYQPPNITHPGYADGGEVELPRRAGDPIPGTRGPLREGEGTGALSREAVIRALLAKRGTAASAPQVDFMNPRAVTRDRLRQAGEGYAKGGSTHAAGCSCKMCSGGALGYVSGGPTGGQGDHIQARLSPGEYVMDADVVSALGDGDNASGAAKLDEMREAIRRHKRGASPERIPPKARSPLDYLPGGRRGA